MRMDKFSKYKTNFLEGNFLCSNWLTMDLKTKWFYTVCHTMNVHAQHSSSTHILHSTKGPWKCWSSKIQVRIFFQFVILLCNPGVLKLFVLMSYVDASLRRRKLAPLNQLDCQSEVSQKKKKKKTQESSPVLSVPSAAAATDEDWENATKIAISSLEEDHFDFRYLSGFLFSYLYVCIYMCIICFLFQ